MKKILSLAVVLVMVLSLTVPALAAPAAVDGDGATVAARVEKLSGNQNRLWITITTADGAVIEQDFVIKNNAAGTYALGESYEVYVDTKGNTQIRECYFTSVPTPPEEPVDLQRFTAGGPEDVFAPVADLGDLGDHTHGPSIARLPDGELLCVWFQGNGERDATTTRIMAARRPAGADEWTTPFVIADAQNIADINPAVFVDSGGRLWMVWYPVLSGMWETSMPRYAYAEPGRYEYKNIGNRVPDWTWSDSIPIKIGPNTGDTVNPAADPFVNALNAAYTELNNHAYNPAYVPQPGDPVEKLYEDLNAGGGVNPLIYRAQMTAYMQEFLKRVGGAQQQSFTPTVADKTGPDAQGSIPRSGYPLLRRIGWQTKNPPLEIEVRAGTVLSNGEVARGGEKRMLIPLYSDGLNISINAITDDLGVTWKMSGPVVGLGNIQASMVQRENGDIVAYMRNNGPVPQRVLYSISADDGETWSIGKPRMDLFCPGVGNCMTKLSDTEWVYVGCGGETGRGLLIVALSNDEGKTWKWRRHIELDTRAQTGSYHYPSVTADDGGNIHIVYTIDHGPGDIDATGTNYNNIRYLAVTREWIKAGDWSDSDTSHKAVFSYEVNQLVTQVPAGFNPANTDTDGKLKTEEVEKLVAALPQTVKAYLTFNNHGDAGLNLAAPEYVEIEVKVDAAYLRNNFRVGATLQNVPYVIQALPDGITQEMLPDSAPVLNALVMVP